MNKTIATSAVAAVLALLLAPSAQADTPPALDYDDIRMARPDFNEPFRRDGRSTQLENVLQVVPGASADQVRALIGNPIRTGHGALGPEWDYDLKLNLADEDFIVCQYKVVFDARNEQVIETRWRRYQRRDAVAQAPRGTE